MGAKVGVVAAILRLRTGANAVGEDGFQPVEVAAADIQSLVDDQPRQVLPDALLHPPCFAVLDGKAFFHGGRADVNREPPSNALKIALP